MADTMTKWGVGPKFTLYAVVYGILMYGLTLHLEPVLRITNTPAVSYRYLALTGSALVALGIPFYVSSITAVMRAFRENRLLTEGVYGTCRHPVYAAWIVFFVPAVALFMDSWALLSTPFFMHLTAGVLVRTEDAYLEKTFGQEFLEYKRKVPAFIPYGWAKKRP